MYKEKKLEYSYSGLEPYLNRTVIYIHYNNHYFKYLYNLNELLVNVNLEKKYSEEELAVNIDEVPIEIRGEVLYNLGGVLNHNLYFFNMSGNNNIIPVGKIKTAINDEFGSYENFKNKFISTAKNLKGSGYTFLVLDKNKKLHIINTSNQDTPYYYGMIPIIALDLWEHAYYLEYKYDRDRYIKNWFNLLDFIKINKLYENNIK